MSWGNHALHDVSDGDEDDEVTVVHTRAAPLTSAPSSSIPPALLASGIFHTQRNLEVAIRELPPSPPRAPRTAPRRPRASAGEIAVFLVTFFGTLTIAYTCLPSPLFGH